jgi:IstB-like ATP binding protein
VKLVRDQRWSRTLFLIKVGSREIGGPSRRLIGKSHILSALGLAMCMRGYRVLFTTAAALLMKLIAAKRTATLERHYRNLDRIDLLLIDELGYVPFEREATDLLFQLISQRYERRSIALTTNLPFEKWTQVFPDEMTARPSSTDSCITALSSRSPGKAIACERARKPLRTPNGPRGSISRRRYGFKFTAPFPVVMLQKKPLTIGPPGERGVAVDGVLFAQRLCFKRMVLGLVHCLPAIQEEPQAVCKARRPLLRLDSAPPPLPLASPRRNESMRTRGASRCSFDIVRRP